MKIILHIGANKTGTTVLQKYFTENAQVLRRSGVCWPKTGRVGSAHYGISNWLGFGEKHNPLPEQELLQARANLFEEVRTSGAACTILSSEYFILRRPLEPLKKFFAGCEVQVVAGLRRHDSWLPSLWAQAIKTVDNPPWGRSFESFLEFQRKSKGQFLTFRDLVETWEAAFPGAVKAFPYESTQMPGGIVPAFIVAAGLDPASGMLGSGQVFENPSLGVDTLSLIDSVQRSQKLTLETKGKILNLASKWDGNGMQVGDFISARLKRQLIEEYQEDYEFLSQKYRSSPGQAFFIDPVPEDDGQTRSHILPTLSAFELLAENF